MFPTSGSCFRVVETVVIEGSEEVDGGVYGGGFFFETHEDCLAGIAF